VALLVHKDDENDTVLVHVDRMVRKKEVPKSLRDQWKPIRMELVEPPKARRATERDKEELKQSSRLTVAPPGEEEVFEVDGAFGIERILDHAVDDEGIVQFKVRYVGFGPDDDLWYDEDVLAEFAPDLVDAYKEAKLGALGGRPKKKALAGAKRKGPAKARGKKSAAQNAK
jgi:hypothetical protein